MKTEPQELLRRLRIIYGEIIQGNTYSSEEEVYLKHPTEKDITAIEYSVDLCQSQAKERGIKTEKEIIDQAMKDGIWSFEQEAEVSNLQKSIEGSSKYLRKTKNKSEQEGINKRIEEYQKRLEKISSVRDSLCETTYEKFLNHKRSDFTVLFAFYKDREFKEPILTKSEFEELEFEDVQRLVQVYNAMTSDFSQENLKRIAALPFFLNRFFLSESDPTTFYGKSIINLTVYQSELYAQGKMYRNVLENQEENKMPPEAFYDDPDKLVSWYYSNSSVSSGETLSDNKSMKETMHGHQGKDFVGGASLVGASAEDMANAAGGGQHVDLNAKLQKLMDEKGSYDMFDLLEIHGVDSGGLKR